MEGNFIDGPDDLLDLLAGLRNFLNSRFQAGVAPGSPHRPQFKTATTPREYGDAAIAIGECRQHLS